MNIANNAPLLDQLAASHALGTLRGGARRRFETLARQSASVRSAALLWQERLGAFTELQAGAAPSPNVWKRIENLVAAQKRNAAAAAMEAGMLEKLRRALRLWRRAALVGAAAGVAAVLVGVNVTQALNGQVGQLTAQLMATPEIRYVAVLADAKADASMLVTFDPRSKQLTLKRVGGYQEAADKSLQLWALPASGGPKSLGVLGGEPVIRLSAADAQVRQVPMLAVSLEPKGGVPSERGPTGPVLFKGALIQTVL